MRRRREWPSVFIFLPFVFAAYDNPLQGYDAKPIRAMAPADAVPFLPPRSPIARGYQPPPQPALFEPPRSYYTVTHHHGRGHGHMPSIQNPPPRPSTNWAPPRPLNQEAKRQRLFEAERHQNLMRTAQFNEEEFLMKAVGQPRPGIPRRQPIPPHRLVYTPQLTGPPATAPVAIIPGQKRVEPPSRLHQQEVSAASVDLSSSLEENPPDIVNNIIVHIYLNSKGKETAHAITKIGPIHGVFGIGTAHGGPGTHQNPIVIVKDFDRDNLKFVDEDEANQMMEEGPANIVEVKAMVSTPDKKIENTLNKAVDSELERAIPVVLNRFHGGMEQMDGDLRKELEQALVDEIAKHLGDTIDNMDDELGQELQEELEKELGKGLEEATAMPSTTRRITVVTMTTQRTTTMGPRTISTTARTTTERATARPTTARTTTTRQPMTTERTTTERTTERTTTRQQTTAERTTARPATTRQPATERSTTERTTVRQSTTRERPATERVTARPIETQRPMTRERTTTERITRPTTIRQPTTTERPSTRWTTEAPITVSLGFPTYRITTEESTTERATVATTERATTERKTRPTTTRRPETTRPATEKWTTRTQSTTEYSRTETTRQRTEETTRPTTTERTTTMPSTTERTTTRREPIEVPPAKIPDTEFNEDNTLETHPGVQATTSRRPPPPTPTIPEGSWTYPTSQEPTASTSSGEHFNIVTSRPIKVVSLESSEEDVITVAAGTVTATWAPHPTTTQTIPSETDEMPPSTGACPTPNEEGSSTQADVLFLLDSSNKFTEDKFMHAITLILNTVERMRSIGPEGIQVSLVQFNSEPYLEFSLRKHNCKQFLKDDIADTQYMTGGSMLGKALEKVMKFAFTKKRGDRPDVPNVLIILTDGQSEDRVQLPVQVSKDHNVTVYVIGTLEANPEYLKNLSGKEENVFQLSSSANTPLASQLADRIANLGVKKPTESEEYEDEMNIAPPHRQPVDGNDLSEEAMPPHHPSRTLHLECANHGFKMQFNIPAKFEGYAVVKGYEKDSQCQMEIKKTSDVGNRTLDFFVAADSCGVTVVTSQDPPGLNSSVIIHLVHAPSLRTEIDRAYLLQCHVGSRPQDGELSTHLDVVKSEVTIAETISLSSLPPTCSYSIRRDHPDGPVISRATVGQAVYHRWDCDGDEKTNDVYGIRIHSCFASDDVEQKYPIVDSQGCSSDLALLTNPVYDEENLSAYALSHVFGVLEHDSLKFVCKLSLCTRDGDGCEGVTPPRCSDNHTDLLVWKAATSPYDPALTSALSTKVDVGEEPMYTRVISALIDTKIFLAISGLMLFAAATLLVVHKLRNQQLASPTPSSIRSRASSHFESGASETSQQSGPPPNPRLAEFLRTFDRNRYV